MSSSFFCFLLSTSTNIPATLLDAMHHALLFLFIKALNSEGIQHEIDLIFTNSKIQRLNLKDTNELLNTSLGTQICDSW